MRGTWCRTCRWVGAPGEGAGGGVQQARAGLRVRALGEGAGPASSYPLAMGCALTWLLGCPSCSRSGRTRCSARSCLTTRRRPAASVAGSEGRAPGAWQRRRRRRRAGRGARQQRWRQGMRGAGRCCNQSPTLSRVAAAGRGTWLGPRARVTRARQTMVGRATSSQLASTAPTSSRRARVPQVNIPLCTPHSPATHPHSHKPSNVCCLPTAMGLASKLAMAQAAQSAMSKPPAGAAPVAHRVPTDRPARRASAREAGCCV
jgi:hypothetical protein